ncbi:MAG: hypothetical protein Q4G33_13145 [bacterium]|nr:hypothetical protein [bacterium]
MGKAVLHNLIDLLNESDTDVIYKILIKFIPETEPLPDEIKAIERAEKEIANGDVSDFDSIDWGTL